MEYNLILQISRLFLKMKSMWSVHLLPVTVDGDIYVHITVQHQCQLFSGGAWQLQLVLIPSISQNPTLQMCKAKK